MVFIRSSDCLAPVAVSWEDDGDFRPALSSPPLLSLSLSCSLFFHSPFTCYTVPILRFFFVSSVRVCRPFFTSVYS